MRLRIGLAFVPVLVWGVIATTLPARAQSYTVLYTFTGGADGSRPFAGLIRDAAGNLYGTTANGGYLNGCGGFGCGTVFKLDNARHLKVLYTFSGEQDGAEPVSGLITGPAGDLFSTTESGGYSVGVVFKLAKAGQESVLYAFSGGSDGYWPDGGVVQDAAGNLYGTTFFGGIRNNGVVFKVDPTGKETVLHSFAGNPDGANPLAGLIRDTAGNLYGVTEFGGNPGCSGGSGCGTAFKIDARGIYSTLYSFIGQPDGGLPEGRLIMDSAGNLYGTTYSGGAVGFGTVFKLDPTGKETILYSFATGANGTNPRAALVRDAHGNLYGTTVLGGVGFGTVFKLDPAGNETVLYSFTGGADGARPYCNLILDNLGNLYGTTSIGGTYGWGVVFKLSQR